MTNLTLRDLGSVSGYIGGRVCRERKQSRSCCCIYIVWRKLTGCDACWYIYWCIYKYMTESHGATGLFIFSCTCLFRFILVISFAILWRQIQSYCSIDRRVDRIKFLHEKKKMSMLSSAATKDVGAFRHISTLSLWIAQLASSCASSVNSRNMASRLSRV